MNAASLGTSRTMTSGSRSRSMAVSGLKRSSRKRAASRARRPSASTSPASSRTRAARLCRSLRASSSTSSSTCLCRHEPQRSLRLISGFATSRWLCSVTTISTAHGSSCLTKWSPRLSPPSRWAGAWRLRSASSAGRTAWFASQTRRRSCWRTSTRLAASASVRPRKTTPRPRSTTCAAAARNAA